MSMAHCCEVFCLKSCSDFSLNVKPTLNSAKDPSVPAVALCYKIILYDTSV